MPDTLSELEQQALQAIAGHPAVERLSLSADELATMAREYVEHIKAELETAYERRREQAARNREENAAFSREIEASDFYENEAWIYERIRQRAVF